ncbi:FtsZ-binding cell division protein ZapB [Pedobacter africanus]|uniref:FtsZ-binding cell division protein ZapB n=1 Tax=Pedobacter africanus TaxID=151894 RepID=A0ACC6KT93_9SPHI|nr:hypothetical protein [Pedobacter africanus]MDR6782575.1 FtsZ-binding cell division protein ZapB [Pedobacter africanus]
MHYILFFLLLTAGLSAVAFQTDTSAYQTQRLRVNALLAERSARFGQYDESLNARTGIFGFQTKKDIRNSNEILRQIVLNDNNIFNELKVLMEYKDLEVRQVKTDANETSNRIQNYKQSIKTLQDQNQKLKDEAKTLRKAKNFTSVLLGLFSILTGTMTIICLRKMKKNEKATV